MRSRGKAALDQRNGLFVTLLRRKELRVPQNVERIEFDGLAVFAFGRGKVPVVPGQDIGVEREVLSRIPARWALMP
ncbi:MAG: hypothetical protein AAFX56_12295 [Pseudomonadota bacterium]